VVGHHDGIARYTVGQARRLGLAAGAGGVRRVVVAVDARGRRVVWGRPAAGRACAAGRDELADRAAELRCAVKLRSRDSLHDARVVPTADGAEVHLDAPALPAPGQACVFYQGTRVLGGGFIRRPARGSVSV